MIFAVHYSKLNDGTIQSISKQLSGKLKESSKFQPTDLPKILSICFQSIQRFHPDAKCVLLTDLETPDPGLENVKMIRYEVDPQEPVRSRLKALILYLESIDEKTPVVFSDYDMIFQKNIENLFEESFDIAFTYRKGETEEIPADQEYYPYPINAGLFLIHPDRHQQALVFLKAVERFFEKNYPDYMVWSGEQISINQFIGVKNIHQSYPNSIQIGTTTIQLFPAAEYNYTVGGSAFLLDYQPNKAILHFKGPRKQLMLEYWQTFYEAN